MNYFFFYKFIFLFLISLQGFKEEDIFNECIFKRDERQYVLKVKSFAIL